VGKKDAPSLVTEESSRGARSTIEMELLEMRILMQRQTEELEAQRALLREQERRLNALTEELRAARGTVGNAESEFSRDAVQRIDKSASVAMTSAERQRDSAQDKN
jgi:hypothetical protein